MFVVENITGREAFLFESVEKAEALKSSVSVDNRVVISEFSVVSDARCDFVEEDGFIRLNILGSDQVAPFKSVLTTKAIARIVWSEWPNDKKRFTT